MRRLALTALAVLLAAAAPLAGQTCSLPRFSAPAPIFGMAPVPYPGPPAPVVGDFDGDGRPDLAAIDPTKNVVALLFGDGESFPPERTTGPAGNALRTGDFNGDGRTDLLVFRTGEVQVLFVAPDRTLGWGPTTEVTAATKIATGDIDGDGRWDFVVFSASRFIAHLATGGGSFGAALITEAVSAESVTAADFNGDGKLDLAVETGLIDGYLELYVGNGDGTFAGPARKAGPFVRPSMLVADFNEDGLPDLALSALFGHYSHFPFTEILLGSRSEGLVFSKASSTPPSEIVGGDFDGDGHVDLVYTGSGGYISSGDGTGGFSSPWSRPLGLPPPAAILGADVDGNGLSDLLTMDRFRLELLRNGCAGSRPDVVLPSLVSLTGVGGTRFESELTLTNRSASPMGLELAFGSESDELRAVYTLAPGEKTFPSALDFLRGLGMAVPSGRNVGRLAFRVTEGPPTDLAAQARTTSQVPSAAGKGGVSIPGVPVTRALRTSAWIPWLAEDSHNRTNLALVHAGGPQDGPITLEVRVTPLSGGVPGGLLFSLVTLAPGEFRQLDRILAPTGAARGYARITRRSGSAPWLAYAVVNDNATGDGSYEEAVSGEALLQRWGALFVPTIVETPRYATELILMNTSPAPLQVRASWRPNEVPAVTTTFELAAGEQLVVPAFVQHLRDIGASGVPPRGADLGGALELTTVSGDPAALLAGARTATDGFGVFTPAVAESEAAVRRVWLFGLRQDAQVRTNLALVNLGETGLRFTIVLHRAITDGTITVSNVLVPAGEWFQLGRILAERAPGNTEMYAEVSAGTTSSGIFRGFLTYAVVNEGSEPGQGSGDGSYVPMQSW